MSYSFDQFETSGRAGRSPVFWWVVGGIAAVACAPAAEYYIYHNRTLHVVNGFNHLVEVKLESGESVSVPPGERREVKVKEGSHRATIVSAGRDDRVTDFTIESDFWSRLFKTPVYVLNVDGGAVIIWEKMVYRKNPVENDDDFDSALHLGKPFVALDDVDYVFKEFPEQLRVKNSQTATKTRVHFEPHPPTGVLFGAPDTVPPEDRLSYAEAHLRSDPNNQSLMELYAAHALGSQSVPRAVQFFRDGLDRRPINTYWHRTYQALRERDGGKAEVVAEYRKRLEADPNNSTWLYLAGRIEPDRKTADDLFRRSIDADPKNPFPRYAQSVSLRGRGDFAGASRTVGEACRLNPDDSMMSEAYYVCRLGAGEASAMERDLEAEWERESTQEEIPAKLWEVLAIQGKTQKMATVFDAFKRRLSAAKQVSDKEHHQRHAELNYRFLLRDYPGVLQAAAAIAVQEARVPWEFAAYTAMGNLDAAASCFDRAPDSLGTYDKLALSIALRQKDDTKRADELQKQVVEALDAGDEDDHEIAGLFRRLPNLTSSDAEIVMTREPYEASLVLTALAQQCPKERSRLLDSAEKRNFRPRPYQQVIRTAIDDARKRNN